MNKIVATLVAGVALFAAASASAETTCEGNTCTSVIEINVEPSTDSAPQQEIACAFAGGKVIAANTCWSDGIAKVAQVRAAINEENKAKALTLLNNLKPEVQSYMSVKLTDDFESRIQVAIPKFVEGLTADINDMN